MQQKQQSKAYLALELVFIFILIPLIIYVLPKGFRAPIPVLLVGSVLAGKKLLNSGTLSRDNLRLLPKSLAFFALRSVGAVIAILAIVLSCYPEQLLDLPQERTKIWIIVCIFYPLLSVLPQEILFRSYFLSRYRTLFGSDLALIATNALIFGFVHIIFGNWLSVLLSTAAGCLLARNYLKHQSLSAAVLEHAVWGITVFTLGLGRFFYHGNAG